MIYVYAITEPMPAIPDVRGFDGAPLEAAGVDGVCGIYSTHPRFECRPEPDALWTHELVVERLMAETAVLPLRFGSTLGSTDELRVSLERDHVRFRTALERVRGCVELAVRAALPEEPTHEPENGRAYLHAKVETERKRESIAHGDLAPLTELAAATSRRERVPDVLSMSYLVPRGQIQGFVDAVRRLQTRHPELTLSLTGPWAPYSFVDEERP